MKSICMIVQNPYDVDVRVRRKAEALVAAGYVVDVLALRGSRPDKMYVLNGVTVRTIALGKKRGALSRYAFEYAAFFLWAFYRVSVMMPRRRYAVIEVNTLPDFLIFAAALARWMGAKLVLDMHEITPEFYVSKYGIAETSRVINVLKRVERVSFTFADRVIAIHDPMLDLLVGRGLPREKATVIMNCVDEARFAVTAQSSSLPRGGSVDKFVMMYHGTLTRMYGLDLAIEAFALAVRDMAGAELWIIGDGPEKSALERLTRMRGLTSRVKLPGFVAPTDIPAIVAECEVGVLPLRQDVFLEFAFPNKLSEYIILGKVVIAPRLRTIRHYFSEDALAYFAANSVEDLAAQMVRVYQNGGWRDELTKTAKVEYSPIRWSVMRRRYLELMEGMTGGADHEATWPATSAERVPL